MSLLSYRHARGGVAVGGPAAMLLFFSCAPRAQRVDSPGPSSSASSSASSGPVGPPAMSVTPFSPVLSKLGAPYRDPLRLSLVLNATFVLTPGSPSFKLGRVERDEIVWGSMSTKGLPRQATWDSCVGRYPDALWMRVANGGGGLDWYRWQPATGFWTADPRRSQPRRVSVELFPWLSSSILVLTTNPASGGVTSRLERLLPGNPKPPRLVRDGPTMTATAPTGEIVTVHMSPAVVNILSPSGTNTALPLDENDDFLPTGLVVRSSSEVYVAGSKGSTPVVLKLQGARWTALDVVMTQPITVLEATPDGTLWALEARGGVWKKERNGDWTSVPVPSGVRVINLRVSPHDGRLWLSTSGAEESWLTLGEVRER